jgi:hypothetical protein
MGRRVACGRVRAAAEAGGAKRNKIFVFCFFKSRAFWGAVTSFSSPFLFLPSQLLMDAAVAPSAPAPGRVSALERLEEQSHALLATMRRARRPSEAVDSSPTGQTDRSVAEALSRGLAAASRIGADRWVV